jgi:hypothetical protein
MTSLLIVVAYLNGAIANGTLSQDPVKPKEGDTSITVDGGELPLQDAKHITVIDEMVAEYRKAQLNNPWWTFQFQWVSGMEGLFTVSNLNPIEIIEGEDYEMPIGWTQLMDDQGNLVWVNEEAVSSCTPNGPYWQGQ